MKKGLVGFLALSTLFSFAVVGHSQKVEAADGYVKATSISVGDIVYLVSEGVTKELKSISTTSTKYGEGEPYSGSIAGLYPLEVVKGYDDKTYSFKNESGEYLYWGSGNSLNVYTKTINNETSWSVTFASDGDAVIISAKDSARQIWWNNQSPRFACYTDKTEETSNYYPVQLYKVAGESVEPETPAVPEDKTEEVTALFTEYYGEGTYTKESVLNTNKLADKEVAKYFHASADTKYRKTEYYPEGLTMTISENGSDYSNESTYTNGDNCVVHTGFGGGFTETKYASVEDWFVTLKDFKESTLTGWVLENGVYTYELTETTATTEHDMTRMAREFVAPMWLAPNAENYAYAQFTKLTVEESGNKLVMKLYVENGDVLVEGSNNVFSQVTISKPTPDVVTNIADALEAPDGTPVVLTGTVTSIYQAYNETYKNISVYIADEQSNRILSYRLKGKVNLGDEITITGVMTTYTSSSSSTRQVAEGATYEMIKPHTCTYSEATCTTPATCTICEVAKDAVLGDHNYVDGICSECNGVDPDFEGEVKQPVESSFNVYANKGTLSGESISWTNNGVTFTNNKDSSETAIRTSDSDHFRLYQGSQVVISAEGTEITKVVITCTSSSYANELKNSVGEAATVSGSTVTITNSGTNTITFSMKKQSRINQVVVIYLPL